MPPCNHHTAESLKERNKEIDRQKQEEVKAKPKVSKKSEGKRYYSNLKERTKALSSQTKARVFSPQAKNDNENLVQNMGKTATYFNNPDTRNIHSKRKFMNKRANRSKRNQEFNNTDFFPEVENNEFVKSNDDHSTEHSYIRNLK